MTSPTSRLAQLAEIEALDALTQPTELLMEYGPLWAAIDRRTLLSLVRELRAENERIRTAWAADKTTGLRLIAERDALQARVATATELLREVQPRLTYDPVNPLRTGTRVKAFLDAAPAPQQSGEK